ncbi:MAG: hypothetical protein ACT4NL_08915 [Pseudomarimonas sp.]
MRIASTLQAIQRRVQWRALLIESARWLPWLLVAVYAGSRAAGARVAIALGVFGLGLLVWRLRHAWKQIDQRWLIRALDHHDRALHDSSDLLFADTATLSTLQALQQTRVRERLLQSGTVDLRAPLPWQLLLTGFMAASLWGLFSWLWQPLTPSMITPSQSSTVVEVQPVVEQALTARLSITPPAYTALPTRESDQLAVQVVEGSELVWSLRFAVQPSAVRVRLLDGETLVLQAIDGQWQGRRRFSSSTVYRIEIEGAPALPTGAPYTIEVLPDRAPQLAISEPQNTLTVLDAAARRWQLTLVATDDYGLAETHLHLTHAQGDGEQVTVNERRIRLRGEGDPLRQQFTQSLDLIGLGFAQGDDLIARIEVRDNRPPTPNLTRSASYILRWPAERGAEGTGVEGLVQKTLPAYFRSQRQIIIDTEALIAEQPRLSAEAVLERSDAIGVDQRLLRLRYGQFLGEEAEEIDSPEGHDHDDHAGEPEPAVGDAAGLIAEFGHGHDIAEAATLLDPATRELLRAALGEMWQAELQLRIGDPEAALPFENSALEFIKRFQQAGRIYLARVGLELPALDATRRLSGERPGRSRTADPLADDAEASPAERTWLALQADASLPLTELLEWVSAQPADDDPQLALLADIDALQQTSDCADCRRRLANSLWPLLTPPAAAPPLRPRANAVGRAYLDVIAPAEAMP